MVDTCTLQRLMKTGILKRVAMPLYDDRFAFGGRQFPSDREPRRGGRKRMIDAAVVLNEKHRYAPQAGATQKIADPRDGGFGIMHCEAGNREHSVLYVDNDKSPPHFVPVACVGWHGTIACRGQVSPSQSSIAGISFPLRGGGT
jgi:hypothetical protein